MTSTGYHSVAPLVSAETSMLEMLVNLSKRKSFRKVIYLSVQHAQRRHSTKKNVPAHKKKYAETILLPKTSFPLRIPGSKRQDLELGIQKACGFDTLYLWQREALKENPEFVLLDGPPYANGVPHMGHFVNKVLKDITTRYKLLSGHRIHYVPGWDCHGLPIELKVITEENHNHLNALEVRKLARDFAFSAIEHQKTAFKRWGVMADWENCYYTIDKKYQITELKAFYEMYKKDLVFRDFKPVYWSPSTRTALAEAELEYNPQHESLSIYVKFRLKNLSAPLHAHAGKSIYGIIWTTTPWTLPSNECIAYNETIDYCLVECKRTGELYVVASDLSSTLEQMFSTEFKKLSVFSGKSLESITYIHPTRKEELRFLPAKHVTTQKGTGLVHSSPSHGLDDFNLGVQNNLPLKNYLDEKGCFTVECSEESLIGKSVLEGANEAIINLLADHVITQEKYVHSYPYDWRSKKPVIIKPSLQWFLNTDKLKDSVLAFLKNIQVFPPVMMKGMLEQIKTRPSWCISRQRMWGIPIPAFYEKCSKKVILNDDLLQHWCHLLETSGSDMWWSLPDDKLLPKQLLQNNGFDVDASYEKGKDIFDIWFDSGISWRHVLRDVNYEADVCLEGVDQSRGWFQSLLITSVALQNKPPFKNLFYHGFTLDDQGRKMSKSLGNVVDPQTVVNGGKNDKSDAIGVDSLRWWVACHIVERPNVRIKQTILDECSQFVQKVRAVLRFLLSNLSDFNSSKDIIPLNEMELIDRYMLHLLVNYQKEVKLAYDSFKYDNVGSSITNFITRDVSAFYLNIVRQRLYCDEQSGKTRRSCQTSLHHLFLHLIYSIAPILPHLAEEAFFHHHQYGDGRKLVFRNKWPECSELWENTDIKNKLGVAIQLREILNKKITTFALDSNEIDVIIQGNQTLYEMFKELHPEKQSCFSRLCEILQVASVKLGTSCITNNTTICSVDASLDVDGQAIPFQLYVTKAGGYQCGRCRRFVIPDQSTDLCSVCVEVIGHQWS